MVASEDAVDFGKTTASLDQNHGIMLLGEKPSAAWRKFNKELATLEPCDAFYSRGMSKLPHAAQGAKPSATHAGHDTD